jgi:hypothetical protein
MIRKLLPVLLTVTLVAGMGINVFATENVDILTENPPAPIGIELYGANAPGSKADVHNLSVSSYNYQVAEIGYRVYTSKWLTGKSSMSVSVSNWTILKTYTGTDNSLTVRLYDSSGTQISSKNVTISYNSGSCSFTGLNTSKKYYICFEVPTNSNKYSFDGSIHK